MVKLAVAGFGEAAREVVKAILAEGHHEITVLSRKDAPSNLLPDLKWTKVNYEDKKQLAKALKGMHTVLSFIVTHLDIGCVAQINLIDTCVEVGVKRFSPSEWAMIDLNGSQFYANKIQIRRYLENLNKPKKVLEYSMFFPGVFMNYLAPPEKMGADLSYIKPFIDFEYCRAILPEQTDITVSFSTIQDLGRVVAKALDYESEWPVLGGIAASKTSISDLLQLGERIRGKPFSIERIKQSDLEADKFTTSWAPEFNHPTIAVDTRKAVSKRYLRFAMLGLAKGAWDIPDVWNQLLPEVEFTKLEDFLQATWDKADHKSRVTGSVRRIHLEDTILLDRIRFDSHLHWSIWNPHLPVGLYEPIQPFTRPRSNLSSSARNTEFLKKTPNINEYSWASNHEQSPAGAAFYISQLECLDSQGLHANWVSGSLLQGLIANLPIKKNEEYSSTGKWHEYTYYYKEMRGQRVVTTPSADEFFKVYTTPGMGTIRGLYG
ncbi:hypothetical protein FOZG_15823 [Fusarium oxysporum Fo47]|uniref:NmrA-like domain-containing protein n=1 Tax=Fusarium oxysporum Fo47 TaxID=660027 RepID=W9JE58_FUSOX|nr:hypothetical protein FOZG_15823 [Fusarium oxysporum Fo47]